MILKDREHIKPYYRYETILYKLFSNFIFAFNGLHVQLRAYNYCRISKVDKEADGSCWVPWTLNPFKDFLEKL
jgi:hypothetical protein